MALSPRSDDKVGREMKAAGKFQEGPQKSVAQKRAEEVLGKKDKK